MVASLQLQTKIYVYKYAIKTKFSCKKETALMFKIKLKRKLYEAEQECRLFQMALHSAVCTAAVCSSQRYGSSCAAASLFSNPKLQVSPSEGAKSIESDHKHFSNVWLLSKLSFLRSAEWLPKDRRTDATIQGRGARALRQPHLAPSFCHWLFHERSNSCCRRLQGLLRTAKK